MNERNDWAADNLRGRIKSIHIEVAKLLEVSGQWREEKRRPVSTMRFNENGVVVKELRHDLDGNLSEIGSTKVDVNGHKIETIFQNPRGGLLTSLTYEYDDDGKLLGSVLTQATGLIIKQRSRVSYDHAGNKTEELWRYEDGSLSRKYVYQYSPDGQIAKQLLYQYHDDGSIEEKTISIFDENGNVIQSACFDKNDRAIEGRNEYKYNDDEDPIETTSFEPNDDLYSTTSYSYDFGSQRNWTKRLEIFKTAKSGYETRSVTYRAFEYY